MQIELTAPPEVETFLLAESSATGLTPTQIAEQLLKEYALGRLESKTEKTSEPIGETPDSTELKDRRRLAVEAWMARRAEPDAPTLNLPQGVSIRKWLHEDNRYKD